MVLPHVGQNEKLPCFSIPPSYFQAMAQSPPSVRCSKGPPSDVNARQLRTGVWRRGGPFGESTGKRVRPFFGAHLPRRARRRWEQRILFEEETIGLGVGILVRFDM